MPKCPNCFFELVLLEHRRKYKCAKCGKLFSQIQIDAKEFREYNLKEREKDKEEAEELKNEAKKEYDKKWREENPKKFKASKKKYYQKNKEKIKAIQKRYNEKNKEKIRAHAKKHREKDIEKYNRKKREYWARNKDRFNEKKREEYKKRKDKILIGQTIYRQNNKTLRRVNNLRTEQKILALRMFESNVERFCTPKIRKVLPTLLLS